MFHDPCHTAAGFKYFILLAYALYFAFVEQQNVKVKIEKKENRDRNVFKTRSTKQERNTNMVV